MIKIKILSYIQSDVSRMIARGWDIRVYRDRENNTGSSVTAEKGVVKFMITQKDDGEHIVLKKFVNETCVDTKEYRRDGTEQCEGTLFINDHSDPTKVYAFFRNDKLQNLMECVGIERLLFVRNSAEYIDEMPMKDGIKTDGTIEDGKITNATFIFSEDTHELMTVQNYNINKMEEVLL